MKDKLIDWTIFVLLSLIWGSSFKLMKLGMEDLTAYQVAAMRMVSAGIVLIPFALPAYKKIPRNKLGMVFLSGLSGNFFPAFLFCIAEIKIDSSLAGILNAFTPLFTLLIGVLFFSLSVSTNRYVGVLIGFTGLVLLFVSRGIVSMSYISYALMVLAATFFYGLNVNLVGKYLKGIASLHIASMAFAMLLIPSIIILMSTGYFSDHLLFKTFLPATAAAVTLGIIGTAVASILFYVLVKRAGGLFASTVTYGIPFVAVFWGLSSGETITFLQILCLGIILVGVYLSNRISS